MNAYCSKEQVVDGLTVPGEVPSFQSRIACVFTLSQSGCVGVMRWPAGIIGREGVGRSVILNLGFKFDMLRHAALFPASAKQSPRSLWCLRQAACPYPSALELLLALDESQAFATAHRKPNLLKHSLLGGQNPGENRQRVMENIKDSRSHEALAERACLSQLPSEVLLHILSYLPFAAR